jgi:hypothetical protein
MMVRRSPETGESAPAGIVVEIASIEILNKSATSSEDQSRLLKSPLAFETFGPKVSNFDIVAKTYDCLNQIEHGESIEEHW